MLKNGHLRSRIQTPEADGQSQSVQRRATWKCIDDLLFRTIFPQDYALQFSPTPYRMVPTIFTFCEQFISLHFPDAQVGQVGFFFAASEWRNLQFAFRQPLVTKNLQSSHGRSILP